MGSNKALGFLSCCLLSHTVVAADWDLTPSIKLTESYTDNVFITPAAKSASLVTQISPQLRVIGSGKHLDTYIMYQINNDTYHSQSQLNDTYDQYDGNLKFKLFDNKWLINLTASKGQRVNQLSDGIRTTSPTISANQSEVSRYSFQTSLNAKVPDLFVYQLNFQANKSHSSQNNYNSDATTSLIKLSNIPNSKNSYWNIEANNSETTNSGTNVTRRYLRNYHGSLGFKFYQDFWLFVQYFNQTTNFDNSLSNKLDSSSYGGGIRWFPSDKVDLKIAYNRSIEQGFSNFYSIEITLKPSQRTNFQLKTGKRYYGDFYEGQFNYRLKRFAVTLGYSEQISSYSLAQFSSPITGNLICPKGEGFNINECQLSSTITPTLTPDQQLIQVGFFYPEFNQQSYLEKRFNLNISYTKRKVTLSASHSSNQRLNLNSDDAIDETFSSANLGYKMSRRANLNLTMSYRNTEVNQNTSSQSSAHDRVTSIRYSHNFSKTAHGSIVLSRNSREAAGSLTSYDENRLSVSITKDF